jgi:hypothetical protein
MEKPIVKGHSAFEMKDVNEIAALKDLKVAKVRALEIIAASKANDKNKAQMTRMIESSASVAKLVMGMTNHILAHPSENLKTIK